MQSVKSYISALAHSSYSRFNVDIMMLCISAMDQARKLKFSRYVHLQSMNKIFQYHYARLILCSEGKDIIFEHGYYISALK